MGFQAPPDQLRRPAGRARRARAHTRRLAITSLEDFGTADAAAKVALLKEWFEVTMRAAKWGSEANVEQVEATIKQGQAELLAKQVRASAELIGLTDDQVRALGRALRLLVADGDPGADTELQRLLEQIRADDERRIERLARKEAERLSGLTLPPEEWVTAPADLG